MLACFKDDTLEEKERRSASLGRLSVSSLLDFFLTKRTRSEKKIRI